MLNTEKNVLNMFFIIVLLNFGFYLCFQPPEILQKLFNILYIFHEKQGNFKNIEKNKKI